MSQNGPLPGCPGEGDALGRRLTLPPHALPIAAFALVATGLLAAVPLLARSLHAEARHRAAAELGAMAELKARQVVHWRENQLRVVRFGASYPSVRLLAEAASRPGGGDGALRAHVSEILGELGILQGYDGIALVAPDGAEVAGWARPGQRILPAPAALVEAARASSDGAASDLRLDPLDRPYLHVAIVVRTPGGPPCLVVARADAAPIFADVLQRWPVPSETAASSLGTRDGDTIRLLVADSSLERYPRAESIPLDDVRRPVTQAFRGTAGLIEGLDFHGTPIFVESREVPGTPWRVQTKIAIREIEAPLRRPLRIISGLVAALLGTAAFLFALSWRQQAARARYDARLRDAQERLALAVTGTHSVWDWDLAGGSLHLEPPSPLGGGEPVARIPGSVDEILARISHPDDVAALRARLAAHLRGETPLFESEHRLPAGAAGPAWIRVRGRVSRRDAAGRPLRFAAVVSDVTERRRMQAQLELSQRMAGLGTLAAGVAHEINNPLASVSANLDFLAHELAGQGELAEVVAEARDGAERVRDVVRGLRAFSSPEVAGRAAADVRAELEAAIRLARNEIRHRARLEVRIGDDLPLVAARTHELGQVFLNLLLNAAQAIPEGHADENVITVEAERTGDAASIRIRDTGVGIPPHVLERIFEPFFTTKPHGVGTGLGLAIAHRIVTDGGGRIEVATQVGDGTAFHVTLPAARAEPEAAPPPPSRPDPPPGGTPRRVLVVDDDPLVARAVVRTLAGRFEVTTATSAVDALGRIEEGEPFDAVLCDLMMPQMTGMELHARVTARDPALARRMLFMTGGAFTEAAARFVEEARASCLEKPFEPATLREAVERAAAA